jgi:hypothetical protein
MLKPRPLIVGPPSLQPATCHGLQRPACKTHSALRGAAAGSFERLNRHPVAFGKSGRHRACMPAAPVMFRDSHPAPMQNTSPLIKTERQKVIETFRFLHIARLRPVSPRQSIPGGFTRCPVQRRMGPREANCARLSFAADVSVISRFKRRNERCDHRNYHGDSEEYDGGTVASPVGVH